MASSLLLSFGMKTVMTLCFAVLLVGCAGAMNDESVPPLDEEAADRGDEAKQDFFGNKRQGAICSRDWECRADDGLICRPTAPTNFVECAAPGEEGDPCQEDDDCASENCVGASARTEGHGDALTTHYTLGACR